MLAAEAIDEEELKKHHHPSTPKQPPLTPKGVETKRQVFMTQV
jgi:hypothetical protein